MKTEPTPATASESMAADPALLAHIQQVGWKRTPTPTLPGAGRRS